MALGARWNAAVRYGECVALFGFGPRYRSPMPGSSDDESRWDRSAKRRKAGAKEEMDLGTKSVIFGVLALMLSWMPLLNIIGMVAAFIAIVFATLTRVPNTPMMVPPDMQRSKIGLILGVVALVFFVASTYIILR